VIVGVGEEELNIGQGALESQSIVVESSEARNLLGGLRARLERARAPMGSFRQPQKPLQDDMMPGGETDAADEQLAP